MLPVLVGLLLTLSCGCQSIRNGGAPDLSFDIDKDLEQLAKHFGEADSINQFYLAATNGAPDEFVEAARHKFIAGRLVMMNIRYIQFIRKTTSEKQLLDSAADILALSLNLAGASVGSSSAKTVLAGIAAGVTGSKVVIDKNFYYEKSVPALIAAMNAQRKQALIPILEGDRLGIEDYPLDQAVTDLHNYYFAGTFLGALQAIQADAGVKEAKAQVAIAKITESDVARTRALTEAVWAAPPDVVTNALKSLAVFGWGETNTVIHATKTKAFLAGEPVVLLDESGKKVPQKITDEGAAQELLQEWKRLRRRIINPADKEQLDKILQQIKTLN